MRKFLEKLLGDPNAKEIKRLEPLVQAINALEPEFEQLTDQEITQKSLDWKKELTAITDFNIQARRLDDILPEAFALGREAAKRTLGMRHFDVQLIGGIVLYQGKIAEMKTGEGKTLVATLPLYLHALTGRGTHLVTPNDYLAKMGAHWMGPIYALLGITVGVINQQGASWRYQNQESSIKNQELSDKTQENLKAEIANLKSEDWPNLIPCTRREAYECDVTYGTNNEFGFDYLRDHMVYSPEQKVQRELNFAIVDEVDSILIDEARTPLIISAPDQESGEIYAKFAHFVKRLSQNEDYEVNEKERFVKILEPGIKKMEQALGVANIYDTKTIEYVHQLEEALKAKALFQRDRDYVVRNGEVIIVDEFTGRLMPGRRYSEGLHQAIEAKEGVEIRQESKTMATITFQNFFRLYNKLAGMTGTAATEAEEFSKIYNLDVIEIPTHRLVVRKDREDVIYKTEAIKFQAIAEEVKRAIERKQPVLIGTVSIEKSERLSKYLKQNGIKHDILNAKNHEREARIIEHAGEPGRVTVATNMAGRGVDIVLGGKKPEREECPDEFKRWEERHQQVLAAGGLYVIGTERHESRRIDNQLRGRSGRQGDPGESQFFISLDDDLMRVFGGERLRGLMERLGLPDNEPIQHKLITNAIEQAQKKVESHNFDIRKHLVDYDDVMNQHREVVYAKRDKILNTDVKKDTWLHEEIHSLLHDDELKDFETKVSQVGEVQFRAIERLVYLRTIDTLWIKHLDTMKHLRESIGLKGYAQKDPLVEYKDAAFGYFQRLKDDIENQVVEMLLKMEIKPAPQSEQVQAQMPRMELQKPSIKHQALSIKQPEKNRQPSITNHLSSSITVKVRGPGINEESSSAESQQAYNPYGKVGRNEPCPCGSGKKFKKCHGRN